MAFDANLLVADLESPANEGFRAYAYDDATGWPIKKGSIVKGNPTIGIGWNIGRLAMTREQAQRICAEQVAEMYKNAVRAWPWIETLDEPRCRALMNMAFNLGLGGLAEFRNMLQALMEKRWLDARDEALASTWAKQEPARASRIADVLATGGVNV